jgi:outer membrane protein OmpA-like peptidoglycan-associated protein
MRVDPFEMSLSEVQSAFIAPVGAEFTTHTLARQELTLAPVAPPEPEPDVHEVEQEPPRKRRRVLVPLALAVVALAAAGGWWAVQGRDSGAVAGAPVARSSAEPTPSPSTSLSPSTKPSSSETPTVTHSKPGQTPSRKPNVTLRSDLAFGFNSAKLSSDAKAAIDKVARQVQRADLHGKIYVDGYTDNLGSAAYGLVLSQHRADAVSTYLQSQLLGAPVSIVSVGHGEADPIADNGTNAGRKANRRVTITLPKP